MSKAASSLVRSAKLPAAARAALALLVTGVIVFAGAPSLAQESSNSPAKLTLSPDLLGGPNQWTSPEGLTSALQVMLLLTVVSLAPALLTMTTCFVRVLVVLGLLRQALGTQQLPPNQVLTSLALFITLAVMTPDWKHTYDEAGVPYTNHQIGLDEAWTRGVGPMRRFMSMQIERCNNSDDVWLFLQYSAPNTRPETYDDVPLTALLPALMLSELKTAFLIGFQIYLPFLIIHMVVSRGLAGVTQTLRGAHPPSHTLCTLVICSAIALAGWRMARPWLRADSIQRPGTP